VQLTKNAACLFYFDQKSNKRMYHIVIFCCFPFLAPKAPGASGRNEKPNKHMLTTCSTLFPARTKFYAHHFLSQKIEEAKKHYFSPGKQAHGK